MMFYRDILSQNLIPYLPCGFIETFCHKIGSATYHACFIVTFCHKICSPTTLFYLNIPFCHKIGSPTYHAVLS